MAQLTLGDITVDVQYKSIKHAYLSVHPPYGQVQISAPKRMDLDAVRLFAISKLGWIRSQQHRMLVQPRETPREYLERESHYVWGKRYLLELHEWQGTPKVEVSHTKLRLWARPGTSYDSRGILLEAWYRNLVREAAIALVESWQRRLGVDVTSLVVRRMKTRWGSCTPMKGSIRLNTELGKKPPACLEFVVVHEMVHLIEPSHNKRFVALMDQHLPLWRESKRDLTRLPIPVDRRIR